MVKRFIIITLILLIFLFSGCWNRREPDELALVLAAAFDLDDRVDGIKVIAQIANPLGLGGEGPEAGGGGNEDAVWVVAASGQTAFEAARNLIAKSPREVNFTHVALVLFSEEMAREGIYDVLDFLDRERQFRLISIPMVVEGDVRMAMEAELDLDEMGGAGIVRHLETTSMGRGVTRKLDMRDIYIKLSKPGWEMVMPRLHLLEENGELADETPLMVSGIAAFKGDRLVGWLDEEESRGYNWFIGEINRAIYILKSPPDDQALSSVEVFQSVTSVEARVEGNEVTIVVEIEADSRLQETASDEAWLSEDSELIDSLDRRLAQAIRNDVKAVVEKAQQELASDVLGFGNIIHRTLPKEWERLNGRWDEIFPEVKVEVKVDANVRRTGLIKDALKIR